MAINHLEPKQVFKHFEDICGIPHPSGHEKKLADHIESFAKAKGFETLRDEFNNVVIRVPATAGHEKAPVIVLQGHIDMVGEKNSSTKHDFLKDPIQPYVDGEHIKAKGTTLGADNGLGVAAGMAIAEDESVVHGPLEILCTVDEEVGLTGAMKLSKDFLTGRIMLNLDGEERNAAYIGCAGGGDSKITLHVDREPAPTGHDALRVTVSGLKGGHSGCDIHLQRGNALRVLVRCITQAREVTDLKIAALRGGNMRNAIARESEATVLIPSAKKEAFAKAIHAEFTAIKNEINKAEPDLAVTVGAGDAADTVLDANSCAKVLDLILALPHGVERMSDEIPGLVETSCNLASMKLENDTLRVELSTRSSITEALRALRDRIAATGRLAGAEVAENDPYPGWKPNLDSKLATIFKEVHKKVLGVEPLLQAIHAGLETGVIGEKYPGMDMISFGPHIEFPHSPDERLNIASVKEFWDVLTALLKRLA
ncbi:MAG: aminoacyl-histidine dipeptidase [Planctomycetota bacterium]